MILAKKLLREDNEITQVRAPLNYCKEEAKNNQRRIAITVKELNNNYLVFDTLKIDFDTALNTIKKLEKKLSN